MTASGSPFQFRPRTIYVKVSTELLADLVELAEWSEPLRLRIERDPGDDTFSMTFKRVEADDA